MKTYIAVGDDIDDLEKRLEQSEAEIHRFKHIQALSITTDLAYEHLQKICEDYELTEQKQDYDISNNR